MGFTIGVIGGGAAGMMAAITAAGLSAKVTLLEGNDRLGKKILSTGNGKCNLGNEKLDMEEYYTKQPDFVEDCLRRFDTEDTVSFFQRIGLMIKSKNGYLYPASEQAAVVLDVLRYEVEASGVHIVTECKAEEIKGSLKEGFVVFAGGKRYRFDRIILACGGTAAPKTGSDGSGYRLAKKLGHSIVPTVPALVQLKCREDYLKSVSGVRADAKLTAICEGKEVACERGELQLTDYGISGIPVFQMSRVINYLLQDKKEVKVRIDFLPDYDEDSYEKLKVQRVLLQEQRTVEEYFTGMLNKKLMLLFMKLAGLKSSDAVETADKRKINQVYSLCRQWCVHVTGSNPYDNAQVSAGGVALDELTADLESRKTPGVYFAGEILDVDGKCGGYNLQWAWCSGYIAGSAAAK